MSDFGPLPEFAWLPVAELHVDRTYQRSLESRRSQGAIERICENFRWARFGAVEVTKGVTGWLIIDGQHRVEAARRCKIATVPCLVKDIASVREQAATFVALNRDRVAVTGFAIYHALVAAGDPEALAMARVCAAADVEIVRYPMQQHVMAPNQTLSVGSIKRAMLTHGEQTATAAMKILRSVFPEPGAVRAHLIVALADMIGDGVNPIVIEAVLKPVAFKMLERRISDTASGREISRPKAARVVIEKLAGISSTAATSSGESRQIPSKSDAPPPVARVAPPPTRTAAPAPVTAAPKLHKPIPVSDGRATKKVGPSREEIDRAVGTFVATKGVTKCPPAAVAPTQADPGSKFEHQVGDEAARQSRAATERNDRRRAQLAQFKRAGA